MTQSQKMKMVGKFVYWPLVWTAMFLPVFFWPIKLSGFWRALSVLLGLAMLIVSLMLTAGGGRTLAKTGHQPERATFWPDKFTDFGVFGCMRHPMHLGLAIFPVALALLSGYAVAICSSGWGVAAALWFVLHIEEKEALQKYGATYGNYMQRVPPFSLRPECFKKILNVREL